MKQADYGILGDGAEDLAGFDSWSERAAYQYCKTLENMATAGLSMTAVDSDDIADADAIFDGVSDNLKTWIESAVAAAVSGDEMPALDDSYIPELIELLALIVTGQWGLVFVLFVKVGLKFVLRWLRSKLPPDVNVDDVAQAMEQIFLDKTDPEDVRNRLADLIDTLQTLSPIIHVDSDDLESVDSTKWELVEG